MTTDEKIGAMCAWLKKNKMVGQTTLAGKLTLTPANEAYTAMLFGGSKSDEQRIKSSERTKSHI